MQKLVEGYRRFRENGYEAERERWKILVEGQRPRIMVIACSDSRVDPATIFDTLPGEMFVVRNVANLVPPFEKRGGRHCVSAALEFAVTQLNIGEIMVLGHGACGGVAAALSRRFSGAQEGQGGFIAHWIDLLDEARERIITSHGTGPEAVRALELEAVRVSLANLRTFPFIPKIGVSGGPRLHGGYFSITDGVLHLLDEASGCFEPTSTNDPKIPC